MLSIVTPVLNGAKYIRKNIQSIQALTIPFEHIIVDGGSTDGTLEIIKSYPHLKLLHQIDNFGMYGAIHQGFLEAKYEIISWVNCDDEIIANNYIMATKRLISSSYKIIYGGGILYYEDYKFCVYRYASPFGKYFLSNGIMAFIQPSVLFKKTAYLNAGGLRYSLFKLLGDIDLFQRFALQEDIRFLRYNKPLSKFLFHSNSLLSINPVLQKAEAKILTQPRDKLHTNIYRLTLIPFYFSYYYKILIITRFYEKKL